jgi:hypothetical protein
MVMRRNLETLRGAWPGAELRVGRLAAEGRTNREIAQRLFVTARTVEAFDALLPEAGHHLQAAARRSTASLKGSQCFP